MTHLAFASGKSAGATEIVLGSTGDWANAIPPDIHPALEEVRKLPEFRPSEPGPWDQLLDQPWFRSLTAQLNEMFEHFLADVSRFLTQIRPPGVATLPESIREIFSGFVGFLLVLLGLYAFYILLDWLLRFQKPKPMAQQTESGSFREMLVFSAADYAERARKLAAQHQYGEAIRFLYLALLRLLDEKKGIPFEPARSNREYTQLLTKSGYPESRIAFSALAEEFEAVRYGDRDALQEDFDACQRHYLHVQRERSSDETP